VKRRAIRKPTAPRKRHDAANRPETPVAPPTTDQEIEQPSEIRISPDIKVNRSTIDEILGHSDDLIQHDLRLGGQRGVDCTVYYYQAMANSDFLHTHVLQPLVVWARPSFYEGGPRPDLQEIRERLMVATQILEAESLGDVLIGLFNGHGALFVDGIDKAMIVRAAGFKSRSLSEPMNETSVRGPFEGLTEDIETSTSLIRRRYKSPHLVIRNLIIGDESRTKVRLVYDQHIAPPAIVREVERRLGQIKRDILIYSATIEHLISDHPYALWPILERTERAERIVDQMTQGRVAILVDGTPFAVLLPATASNYFWAPDDQSEPFYFAALMRIMRVISLVISAFMTPVYVALVTFHPEMIPLPLMLNIAVSQEGVPFPLIFIAFVMEIVIEVVREAGIRLPRPVGAATSIVGTIVIGQAAITAGFAPPGLVVVVAVAAIASFALPDYGAAVAFRLLRFPALLAGGLFGLYGVSSVAMLALFDLCSIKSFGVPFLAMYTPGRGVQLLESLFIAPPRLVSAKRKMSYRDRYRAGPPPRVKARAPLAENALARKTKRK